jgi:hypothetical protein
MKEEFTTAMHAELIGKEISSYALNILGAYGAMSRGINKQTALKKYKLTEEEYEDNIERILNS